MPFSLCNPRRRSRSVSPLRGYRRSLRRRIHRSWEDPYGATVASDELAIERLMRALARRNPGRLPSAAEKSALKRFLRSLTPQRRTKLIRSVLGKMNPPRRGKAARRRFKAPSTRDWRGFVAVKRAMKINPRRRSLRNPRRDGSPTRGELRKAKKVEYLRSLVAKGQDAAAIVERMLGAAVPKDVFGPTTKRAQDKAMKDHAKAWNEKHTAELRAKHAEEIGDTEAIAEPAPAPAAPPVIDHPEVRMLQSRISDLDIQIKGYQDEIKEISGDETMEDEEARLQEEIAKLARLKKKLRDKIDELVPAATNPRRRGMRRRARRLSPQAKWKLRRLSAAAKRAFARLRTFMRRSRSLLRSR